MGKVKIVQHINSFSKHPTDKGRAGSCRLLAGATRVTKKTGVNMYVYIESESGLWTVGFYTPSGKWEPESDHTDPEEAAKRVAWLNGGGRI